ncbi:MAG: pantetheine-phosphate adenylyltransferase [Bacteroidota bacterium]|nr:pantetheine-phosphate adenylyltransferase [Bacteroidota bacterium]
MKNKALFPGSFDPITVGHESIVKRALPLFDELVIGIGVNQDKHKLFPLDKRVEWIKYLFKDEKKLSVEVFEGLTVDFCKKINARYLLRGLRTSADFEYERAVGQTNKVLDAGIETVFLLTRPEHTFISSSIVKDVYKSGGDVSKFIPKGMKLDV